jgi:cell wall-associated NlpC family hydrolase
VRTHGKHRRVPVRSRHVAATASLASAALLGSAFAAGPASAADTTPAPGASGASTTIDPAAPQGPVAHVAATASLTANHSSVKVGETVTFTAAEKAADGTPIAGVPAKFYVHTAHGWNYVRSSTLGANGTATFTFKPNYDHAYKVELADTTVPATAAHAAVEVAAATTPSVTVKAVQKDIGALIVAAAAKEKGRPYVFGAAGPKYFDCSGLVQYVYRQFGINLPHHADSMKHYGTRVSEKDAKPGDLVFVFSGSYAHHVAIYAGNGMWWEAPHPGASVRLVKIWSHNIEFRHITK